jgi:serine O-acetyltransferase
MIFVYRISRWLHLRGVPLLPTILKGFNRILFSIALPPSAQVGKGVLFGYHGLGIVVHANAVIGDRVKISPNVVIGGRGGGKRGVPLVESDVVIGAGACILGAITLGKGSVIGANSVVLDDVPAGAVVAGIPARVIKLNMQKSDAESHE